MLIIRKNSGFVNKNVKKAYVGTVPRSESFSRK